MCLFVCLRSLRVWVFDCLFCCVCFVLLVSLFVCLRVCFFLCFFVRVCVCVCGVCVFPLFVWSPGRLVLRLLIGRFVRVFHRSLSSFVFCLLVWVFVCLMGFVVVRLSVLCGCVSVCFRASLFDCLLGWLFV